MPKIKISIVIVYHNGKRKLINCLDSIFKNKPTSKFEIIIVDNSKNGLSISFLNKYKSKVKYIKSERNLGYGAGNNLGVKNSSGEYIFIQNPDTLVLKGSINTLISFLNKNKDTAIVAPNLVDKNLKVFTQLGSRTLTPLRGMIALSFLNKIFPNNKISKEYYLKDKDLNKLREVDAVPGSAFLIRKKIFEKVGGFDEKMFLYFEESDLGKRIKGLGYRIFINPKSKVVHFWKDGQVENQKLKYIFTKSRFYYFKKHYGLMDALLVEVFANFSKYYFALFLILILAILLRFYRIPQNLVFHGELGDNYLNIKNFIANKEVPLLGPPTSHPWLSFSPLYYWVFVPILYLFKFNPAAGPYFFAFENLILIAVNFWVVKKILNSKVAAISSYLIAISPLWMSLTRESRFFSLSIIFLYPVLYLLIKNPKKFFLNGIFLGLSLSFHLTPLFLVPFCLFVYFLNKNLNLKSVFKFLAGIFLTQVPFLIYNITHKFVMLIKFLEWVPYRAVTSQKAFSVSTFYDFIAKSFVANTKFLSSLVFLLFIITFIYLAIKFYKNKKSPIFILISWFITGAVSLFIHGNPPSHYLMPLYFVPIIIVSYTLSKINRYILLAVLIAITFINLKYYFSNNWFYIPQDKIENNLLVPFRMQKEVSKFIINDAKGEKFNLSRVGYSDQFQDNYDQNYQYLLWLYGNTPVKDNQKLKYVVIESPPDIKVVKIQ